jgi:hypothetical protein
MKGIWEIYDRFQSSQDSKEVGKDSALAKMQGTQAYIDKLKELQKLQQDYLIWKGKYGDMAYPVRGASLKTNPKSIYEAAKKNLWEAGGYDQSFQDPEVLIRTILYNIDLKKKKDLAAKFVGPRLPKGWMPPDKGKRSGLGATLLGDIDWDSAFKGMRQYKDKDWYDRELIDFGDAMGEEPKSYEGSDATGHVEAYRKKKEEEMKQRQELYLAVANMASSSAEFIAEQDNRKHEKIMLNLRLESSAAESRYNREMAAAGDNSFRKSMIEQKYAAQKAQREEKMQKKK